MSKVDAHYEFIPKIKGLRDKISPDTLITINGDVDSREKGEELANQYDIDGVMIGRGVFQNPFVFEANEQKHSIDELTGLLSLHLDLHDKYEMKLGPRKYDPLKRFFKVYIHDFSGANELRQKMMATKNTDEARQVIASFNQEI
jgi:tRNA-dihydrouridine synthase